MKIKNIKVRGAIGFKKNLGLDEIELDLSNQSGLIALAGPNGYGKTTLLESLSPFRTFASRSGALKHHFFLRDSFRDLSFEYGGDLYRTLVKVDADSDRSEGFIWKNGAPQVDGKVTKYNEYIVSLLGSANLFYNSVFCAQNADKLSDMTTGQVKQLFVEFLRLDRLTGYENAAKKCIGVLHGMGLQEERGIDTLKERIGQFGAIEVELHRVVEDEERITGDRAAEEKFLKEAVDKIETLKETLAQNKVNTERVKDLDSDIQAIHDEISVRKMKIAEQYSDIDLRLFSSTQSAEQLRATIARKEELLAAADQVKVLEGDIEALKETLSHNEINTKRRDELQRDITIIHSEITDRKGESSNQEQKIDQEIADAKTDVSNLNPIIAKTEEIRGAAGEAMELDEDIEFLVGRLEGTEVKGRALAEEISKNEQRQNEITRAVLELGKDLGVYGLETQLNEVLEEIKGIEQEIEKFDRDKVEAQQSFALVQVESDIKSSQDTMALLEKRDPTCQSETCSFIVAGIEAEAKLPGLEKQKQDILDMIKKNVDSIQEKIAEKRRSLQLRTGRRDAFQKDLDAERQAVAIEKGRLDKEFESNRILLTDKNQARVILLSRWQSDKFLLDNELKPALEETQALVNLVPKLAIAESRLIDLAKKIKELTEKKSQLQVDLDQWADTQNTRLTELQDKVNEAVGNIDPTTTPQAVESKKELLEHNRALAAQLPQVEIAESRLADLEKKIEELTEKKSQLQVELDQMMSSQATRLAELNSKRLEIEALINLNADQDIRTAERRQTMHTNTIEDMDKQIAAIKEQITILNQKLEEKKAAEKTLVTRQAEYDRIKGEISQWDYLKLACSKTGLQALEIDGVAPLVTGYANDLLSQSFGPNFSVKLVTQDPETGKEVLDIIVIRGDGSETKLENLSGGEKVWILKALRLAMTLVSKEKSGRNFESFFADEEDGPLDGEKACNFIGLYRSMMNVGKFGDCFYISHNPDVVAMADHHIRFSGEGIKVA
ncbi:MAG: SMC family ATPase [Desulfobacterium sp.]|nr:SMC family ATPase [Desulfobacterium sp.]